MNDKYIHFSECRVEHLKENTLLVESDGEVLWFPGQWTEEQLKAAISLANGAYAAGVRIGKHHKLDEIRRALELKLDEIRRALELLRND